MEIIESLWTLFFQPQQRKIHVISVGLIILIFSLPATFCFLPFIICTSIALGIFFIGAIAFIAIEVFLFSIGIVGTIATSAIPLLVAFLCTAGAYLTARTFIRIVTVIKQLFKDQGKLVQDVKMRVEQYLVPKVNFDAPINPELKTKRRNSARPSRKINDVPLFARRKSF